MICTEEQFDAVELIKTFSINLNAQYVNGRTHFDLAELVKLVKMHVWFLDTFDFKAGQLLRWHQLG